MLFITAHFILVFLCLHFSNQLTSHLISGRLVVRLQLAYHLLACCQSFTLGCLFFNFLLVGILLSLVNHLHGGTSLATTRSISIDSCLVTSLLLLLMLRLLFLITFHCVCKCYGLLNVLCCYEAIV